MTSGRPTIDDVAALAGVARVTVSRVLNGGPNVTDRVRQADLNAVEELQYKVNIQARALASNRSRMLGLVCSSDVETEPNSFYHAGIELGALRACGQVGFHLSIHPVNPHSLRQDDQVMELVHSRRYDGLILTPPFCDDLDLLEKIKITKLPMVALSAGRPAQRLVPSVSIDDEAAGFEMTHYLLSLGHHRFAFIKGLEGHVSAEDRYLGFCRALAEAGLDPEAAHVERGTFTFRSGADFAAKVLTGPSHPTALVCANDDMAVGALFTAHKMGLNLPQDLSIVGFDDTPVSEIIWPPLTTVHQPLKVMGARAAEILFKMVCREPPSATDNSYVDLVAHRLVIRESAAAPKRP